MQPTHEPHTTATARLLVAARQHQRITGLLAGYGALLASADIIVLNLPHHGVAALALLASAHTLGLAWLAAALTRLLLRYLQAMLWQQTLAYATATDGQLALMVGQGALDEAISQLARQMPQALDAANWRGFADAVRQGFAENGSELPPLGIVRRPRGRRHRTSGS